MCIAVVAKEEGSGGHAPHKPLISPERQTLVSSVAVLNTVTRVPLHRAREHSEQPLISLRGKYVRRRATL